MFWGKKQDGRGTASGGGPTGHLDQWESLAVDYLDGTLDEATITTVESHLADCPECAARLEMQRGSVAFLQSAPLAAAPADLEDLVLDEVLFPSAEQTAKPEFKVAGASGLSVTWRRKIRPWIPATVAVAAVLIALVSYGVYQSAGSGSEDMATTTAVAVADQEAAREAGDTSSGGNAGAPTTAAPAATTVAGAGPTETALGTTPPADAGGEGTETTLAASVTTTTAGATTVTASGTDTTAAGATSTTAAETYAATTFTTVQDRKTMIAGVKDAEDPVYFVFDAAMAADDSQTKAADEACAQITTLTGLEPLSSSLSLDGTTFAAFLPRDDASQLVDLLRSIGSSLSLAVGLAMELPSKAGTFYSRLMSHKSELPELLARRTPQPAVSGWTFTTSTSVPGGESPGTSNTQPLDETGTHVLIVILMGD